MMNNLDNLSMMSGISNISRISKVGNSFYHKSDFSTISDSSFFDINKSCVNNNQKINAKNNPETATVRSLNLYEESTNNYSKQMLIYKCLEEIVQDKNFNLDQKTFNKLKNFLTIHEVKKYLSLSQKDNNSDEELTLLGIVDLPNCDFDYEDRLSIRSCVENRLREKINSFISVYTKMMGSTKDLIRNNESILKSEFQKKNKSEVLHWKDKIDEVCLDHGKNLDNLKITIDKWNELKLLSHKKVLEDCEKLLLRTDLAEKKAMIASLTCSIRLFKESPITSEAYKILTENLEEKINSIQIEIKNKIQLKKAYEALHNTEFDSILKKYLEICNTIERKKRVLDKL